LEAAGTRDQRGTAREAFLLKYYYDSGSRVDAAPFPSECIQEAGADGTGNAQKPMPSVSAFLRLASRTPSTLSQTATAALAR
jgi:hypothetical protein